MMGAEGTIVVMPRWQWDEHTDVDPATLFYTGRIMGTEALWSYYGEPDYEMAPEMWSQEEKLRELIVWFKANAEHHEVWT